MTHTNYYLLQLFTSLTAPPPKTQHVIVTLRTRQHMQTTRMLQQLLRLSETGVGGGRTAFGSTRPRPARRHCFIINSLATRTPTWPPSLPRFGIIATFPNVRFNYCHLNCPVTVAALSFTSAVTAPPPHLRLPRFVRFVCGVALRLENCSLFRSRNWSQSPVVTAAAQGSIFYLVALVNTFFTKPLVFEDAGRMGR